MTDNPMVQKMKDAAFERWNDESAKRREIEAVIFGSNRPARDRIGDIIAIGDDWLVEVLSGTETLWTSVIGGKKTSQHYYSQERAILHLIARRYEDGYSDADTSVFYAARVLGIPED